MLDVVDLVRREAVNPWAERYEERWLAVAGEDPEAQSRARNMISVVYSVMAEVPGPYEPSFLEDVDAYIGGEIDIQELLARGLSTDV